MEEKPLPPGQYDFYKTELGETVEIYVDAGIDWFNRQIRERSYEERYLDKVIRVDDLIFAEFIATRSSRALLCFGRPPVKKGWRPMRGEGGMYYKEMDLSWNVTRDVMKNAFGLTSDQAARFMKEYRLQKKQPKRRRNH